MSQRQEIEIERLKDRVARMEREIAVLTAKIEAKRGPGRPKKEPEAA